MLPSASLSEGVVFVSLFRSGYQGRAAGAPLDGDLCSVTGCPARGGRPSVLAGVATG